MEMVSVYHWTHIHYDTNLNVYPIFRIHGGTNSRNLGVAVSFSQLVNSLKFLRYIFI